MAAHRPRLVRLDARRITKFGRTPVAFCRHIARREPASQRGHRPISTVPTKVVSWTPVVRQAIGLSTGPVTSCLAGSGVNVPAEISPQELDLDGAVDQGSCPVAGEGAGLDRWIGPGEDARPGSAGEHVGAGPSGDGDRFGVAAGGPAASSATANGGAAAELAPAMAALDSSPGPRSPPPSSRPPSARRSACRADRKTIPDTWTPGPSARFTSHGDQISAVTKCRV